MINSVSLDALTVWDSIINEAFKDPYIKWIMVPLSYYVPKKGFYNYGTSSDEAVDQPIVFTRYSSPREVLLKRAANGDPENREMALGTSWVVGYEDSRIQQLQANCVDGKPGKRYLTRDYNVKSILKHFHVLDSGNGFHFYAKDPLAPIDDLWRQADLDKLTDTKWSEFRRLNRCYLRLTHNVRPEIKLMTEMTFRHPDYRDSFESAKLTDGEFNEP